MQVRIRLQRTKSNAAQKTYNYRIVAIPREDNRQGRALEILGYYDPAKKPATMKVDLPKLDAWVEKGAQMSDTVRSIVKRVRKSS